MKTLEDIQNELSNNDYDSDWNELSLVEQWSLSDEVAKRYATEAIKTDRQRVAEKAKIRAYVILDNEFTPTENVLNVVSVPYRNYHYKADKESILNLPIELP